MIPIALSPCPNDTFLFHAWVSGLVGNHLPPNPIYADVQQLNTWALEARFPITKLSLSCLNQVKEHYQLLPVGTALGENCGPKIVASSPFNIDEIKNLRIAIPGRHTTANHLFDHLIGECQEKVFCLYHEILPLLREKKADCGLIIHETRFTFKNEGFYEVCDLGEIWNERYHLPLPLGGIAVRRDLEDCQVDEIYNILSSSLKYARFHTEASREYILNYSQEKDPMVIAKHIQTYVTKEADNLSERAIKAICTLLDCPDPSEWLYSVR